MRLFIAALLSAAAWPGPTGLPAQQSSEPAPSKQQFNLDCVGSTKVASSGSDTQQRNFRGIFRIDLDRREYCETVCMVASRIQEISPTLLTLYDSESSEVRSVVKTSLRIDRTTGELTEYGSAESKIDYNGVAVLTKAYCTVAPFTGLPPPQSAPAPKTKF